MGDACKPIEVNIVEAVAESPLLDLASSWADLGIEALLDSDLLQEVPLLSQVVSLWQGGQQIRSLLFTKKLLRFLQGAGIASEEERLRFVGRMRERPNEERRVGEHLILILEQLDDMSKPVMIGRVFADYMRRKITYDEFRQMAKAIEATSIQDLELLVDCSDWRDHAYDEMVGGLFLDDSVPGAVRSRLLGSGLVERTSVGYEVTQLGRYMARYIRTPDERDGQTVT